MQPYPEEALNNVYKVMILSYRSALAGEEPDGLFMSPGTVATAHCFICS